MDNTGRWFGKDACRKSILERSLYGFKSAKDEFQNQPEDFMHHLVFLIYPTDLDMWMKPMVRPEDGFNYYVYVLIYVNDVMVIHNDAKNLPRRIDK